MNGNILKFDDSGERYRYLSDEYADRGDYEKALGLSFSALKKGFSPDIIMDIADTYADMGLYELSNQYWFIYMDKAPKEKVSVAYEELGINFYYMDNVWAAGYYFHLKLSEDGYISREGLEQEIIDFFSGEQAKRRMFKTVYPPEKSDWTWETFKSAAAKVTDAEKGVYGFASGSLVSSSVFNISKLYVGIFSFCSFIWKLGKLSSVIPLVNSNIFSVSSVIRKL